MTSVIEFNSKANKYAEFSNFHESPFEIDGKTYPTVEHWFQSQKFPTDNELQEQIRTAPSPAKAKKLGRTKSVHFQSNWNSARDEVMKRGVTAKFEQNAELMELLRSTDGYELKEKAFWDSYWGTGRNGKGQNKMGKLLMEIIK